MKSDPALAAKPIVCDACKQVIEPRPDGIFENIYIHQKRAWHPECVPVEIKAAAHEIDLTRK
jgi:hypothetical protein